MLRPRILLVLALVLGACGSGGGDGLDTVPPTSATPTSPGPGAHDTTSDTAAVGTSVAAPTTVTGDATSAPTTVAGTIGLSPGGPWTLVDSAPGIRTPGLVYELMPKLWVYLPVQEDIANGITWTFTEQDRPIIEAYLQAQLTYYSAITSDPIDLEDESWSLSYADGGASYRPSLEKRRTEGQVADLAAGVVLRPQVLGDRRTDVEAVVVDCVLDGGVFRMPDGSLASGSTPGVVPYGIGMRTEFLGSRWIITQVGNQGEAC